MANIGQKNEVIKKIFGIKLYETNPSITDEVPTRIKKGGHGTSKVSLFSPDTGELFANGALSIVEEKEVDTEEFMKMYKTGIGKMWELTKSGQMIFDYVYSEMTGHNGMNKDTVALNAHHIKKWKPDINVRTFNRGLRELLEKEFLFRSVTRDLFFINVRYMFNGDRLALVKLYRRKSNQPIKQKQLHNKSL